MKAFVAVLLSALLVAACTDSPPTGITSLPEDYSVVQNSAPVPCADCVFGPRLFWSRPEPVKLGATFAATPGEYILFVEDDGNPLTTAAVWLNGVELVSRADLLGNPQQLVIPVTLRENNTLSVAVRGGKELSVTIWILPRPFRVFGPRTFWSRLVTTKITLDFPAPPREDCSLTIRDDDDPLTSAVVWLNGVEVVSRPALLGRPDVFTVPVSVLADNSIAVVVRGGKEHSVSIWIDCN